MPDWINYNEYEQLLAQVFALFFFGSGKGALNGVSVIFDNNMVLCGDSLSASGIREKTFVHDTTYSKSLVQLFALASKSLELQLQLLGLGAFGHRWLSCRNRPTTGNCHSYSR